MTCTFIASDGCKSIDFATVAITSSGANLHII